MPKQPKLANILTDTDKNSSGIFAIRAIRDSRAYVGASQHLGKVCTRASRALRNGQHESHALQAYATRYGLSALYFEVLALCPAEELAATKQRYLDQLQACNPAHGFNSLNPAAPAGQKMSAEARARCSSNKKGRPAKRTAAHQEKLAATHRGRTRSSETRAAISAATLGKPKRPRSTTEH